ncbi:hypothetical protein [Enterococcus sp. DIV0210g]|jgi:uncharacterized membrane-anchored protein YhcB (DUF1043 family)|uniref:hypothetical protein n=1 Tax=Enterococcus sp. DIV0210g TaxID=2774656 RepID=UPI003D300C2C
MLDVLTIAAWSGAIMTIIGLVSYLVKPIMSNFTKISDNLTKMSHTLDMINKDLESSKSDRIAIHDELKEHDRRLDSHKETLIEHGAQLKSIWKKVG